MVHFLHGGVWSAQKPALTSSLTYHISSGEDDWQAEGRDDYACREEDGQLLAGVAGRVCVVHHPPRDAVRDGAEDVEEEQKQRPVCAAESRKSKGKRSLFSLILKTLRTLKDNNHNFQKVNNYKQNVWSNTLFIVFI